MAIGLLLNLISGFFTSVAETGQDWAENLPDAGVLGMLPIGDAVGLMRTVDSILPVHEVLPMLTLAVQVQSAIFGLRLALTIWHALPGKAT
jgi:hypothetical protein